MNIKIIGLICLLMFHCQKEIMIQKQAKDKINSENNNKEVKKTVLIANDSLKKNKEDNEFLTNENAMFFLADYAKKHTENKVRIELIWYIDLLYLTKPNTIEPILFT